MTLDTGAVPRYNENILWKTRKGGKHGENQESIYEEKQGNLLTGLIINETANADGQYVYASELKLLAAVSAQQLDVILMDTAARDQLQDEEYFLDLRTLDADFSSLDELSADGLTLDISDSPFIAQAGFEESVYLGVIANAPHPERAAAYIRYLLK